MNDGPTAPANWYPDPSDPTHLRFWDGTAWTGHTAQASATAQDTTRAWYPDPNRALGLAFLYGLLVGAVTGAVSGTVAAPVIGTIVGIAFGVVVAIPVSFIAAVVVSRSVGSPQYRRRVDATLIVLGSATAVLAIGWISLRALVGPWPALAMQATVMVGLLAVRPRLHRLGVAPT